MRGRPKPLCIDPRQRRAPTSAASRCPTWAHQLFSSSSSSSSSFSSPPPSPSSYSSSSASSSSPLSVPFLSFSFPFFGGEGIRRLQIETKEHLGGFFGKTSNNRSLDWGATVTLHLAWSAQRAKTKDLDGHHQSGLVDSLLNNLQNGHH